MLLFRTFIGTHKTVYSVAMEYKGEYLTLPSRKSDKADRYGIVMEAIRYTLSVLIDSYRSCFVIRFYCDDFDIYHDFVNIKKKNIYPENKLRQAMWKEILTTCSNKGIIFSIEDDSIYANKLGEVLADE